MPPPPFCTYTEDIGYVGKLAYVNELAKLVLAFDVNCDFAMRLVDELVPTTFALTITVCEVSGATLSIVITLFDTRTTLAVNVAYARFAP
jgi:hypothetical protein